LTFEGFPLIIGWEFTLECNLRCGHCASSAERRRLKELTTREALDICDQFPSLLVQEVDFTGGEPMLRSDWIDVALHLKDIGIATRVLTNGLVLTPEIG
jgi:MoaA/NifB/PqqE/SkfB family radical SAM enzyme